MDSFEEFPTGITVINIVALIAIFLLNTGRALSCFKLSKECLVLLDRGILGKGNVHVKTFYRMMYELMFSSYCQFRDYRDPDMIECGHKVLAFLRESGEKAYEGNLTFLLAELNHHQSRYEEAIELYERAASVMMDIGEREKEGFCHKCLGILFNSLNERDKAEKCLRKASDQSRGSGWNCSCFLRVRCTLGVGGIVGNRRQSNKAVHESFLWASCPWGKCQWISSPSHAWGGWEKTASLKWGNGLLSCWLEITSPLISVRKGML